MLVVIFKEECGAAAVGRSCADDEFLLNALIKALTAFERLSLSDRVNAYQLIGTLKDTLKDNVESEPRCKLLQGVLAKLR